MDAFRYSRVAMVLHWVIALALAFQIAMGFHMASVPLDAGRFQQFQLHKSVGIAILALTLARVAWRLAHRPTVRKADHPFAHRVATVTHAGLYIFMVGAPLTGWAVVSTARIAVPTRLFGAIPLPHLPLSHDANPLFSNAHISLAWLGIGLFLLHLAGALRHQFLLRDGLLWRMLPVRRPIPDNGVQAVGAFTTILILLAAAGAAGWTWHGASGGGQQLAPRRAIMAKAVDLDLPRPGDGVRVEANKGQAVNVAEPGATVQSSPLKTWRILPGGQLGFTTGWQGSPIAGRFSRWSARIRFSPDQLDQSTIAASIDLTSATTADGQRDDMVRGASFLDASANPDAKFTATGFRRAGKDRYEASGSLALKGVTRPVRLHFTLRLDGDRAHVAGNASLDRTHFNVGTGEWAATDAVPAQVVVTFDFDARAGE